MLKHRHRNGSVLPLSVSVDKECLSELIFKTFCSNHGWWETYCFSRLCAPDNANVSKQARSGTEAENSLHPMLDVNMTEFK
jgi:hypothetical protein